eukprot:TRINITY_DN35270_c0_g1_i1.p2 TRINITY_DN35270_c0_g1~~TRINITY_DN35270_c0_g1_i1.p2  ORF type:complete len:182 (+),score=14.59 TRINITY_DN35270_c0_g1_i1:103-648(+)
MLPLQRINVLYSQQQPNNQCTMSAPTTSAPTTTVLSRRPSLAEELQALKEVEELFRKRDCEFRRGWSKGDRSRKHVWLFAWLRDTHTARVQAATLLRDSGSSQLAEPLLVLHAKVVVALEVMSWHQHIYEEYEHAVRRDPFVGTIFQNLSSIISGSTFNKERMEKVQGGVVTLQRYLNELP